MKNRNYRIIEIIYDDGGYCYKVQRECRFLRKYLFWGTKRWRTYGVVNEGFYECVKWFFSVNDGKRFLREDDARSIMIQFKNQYHRNKIKSIHVI